MVRSFEGVWAKTMSGRVDLVMDASRVERIHPAALATLIGWAAKWRTKVASVVRQSASSATVCRGSCSPVSPHPRRDAPISCHARRVRGASRTRPEGGDALCRELDAIVDSARGLAPEVRALRDLLRTRCMDLVVVDAARTLGLSTRSLQRVLSAHGTSFQRELREARFARAHELLTTTDDKVVAIAHAIGVTETALAQLIREHAGCTPTELRRKGGSTRSPSCARPPREEAADRGASPANPLPQSCVSRGCATYPR